MRVNKPTPKPCDYAPRSNAKGQFLEGTLAHGASSSRYKLYIPKGVKKGQTLPLVVMLHGCTQDPDAFAASTQMNGHADAEPCYVLYPAQSYRANSLGCWNWFRRSDQRGDAGESSHIAEMTRHVMNRLPVDARRVYVAGFSAGGAMAAIMTGAYPKLFAAACVHSGLARGAARSAFSAMTAMQGYSGRGSLTPVSTPVPTIVFHGDRDGSVHPRNGDAVLLSATSGKRYETRVRQAEQTAGAHAYTRTRYLDPEGQTVLEGWRVHGAGHAWFGGSSAGTFTDARGPDATQAMLRFFSEHVRA